MNVEYHQSETEDKLEGIIKPAIYSKRAIWGFSLFFTPLFGGILLMQNLKDIDNKREANLVLGVSILLTALTVGIVTFLNANNRAINFLSNMAGAAVLTECFYKKYFGEEEYEKKKIWKPLIIGIIICAVFIFLAFTAQDQVV